MLALAADVLGGLDPEQIPASLRQVARFTAAKRARLGGSAIATALDGDPGFRRRVLDAARMTHPGLVEALSAGPPPPAADPADVAVVAYLLRADGWAEIVAAAAAEIRRASEEEQATRADVTTVRLREQLAAARAEAREDRARSRAESDRLKVENAALRRQANQARADAARADEAGQAKVAAAARSVELAEAARASAEAEARRLRGRLAEVEEALSSSRRAGREGRPSRPRGWACCWTRWPKPQPACAANSPCRWRASGRRTPWTPRLRLWLRRRGVRATARRSTTCSRCRDVTSSSTDTT